LIEKNKMQNNHVGRNEYISNPMIDAGKIVFIERKKSKWYSQFALFGNTTFTDTLGNKTQGLPEGYLRSIWDYVNQESWVTDKITDMFFLSLFPYPSLQLCLTKLIKTETKHSRKLFIHFKFSSSFKGTKGHHEVISYTS
jgi:hypothetical protein